jgi:hypothetical protein
LTLGRWSTRVRFRGFVLLPAACLMFSALSWGQADTARIVGTVKDSTGGIIPGAMITIVSEKTGQERTATTNEVGEYVVTTLPAATYTVKAASAGLSAPEYKGITLQVGQEKTVNITLQPSGVSTEVTVSDTALAAVDTSSATIGGNVSEREVAELPINGREISQLYLLAPGAVNFAGGTFDDIRFNGRSFEQNAVRLDGIEAGGIISNNPSNIGGEMGSDFRLQASMENVQEFRVESSNYPAEFGTGSSGQISIVTKSGGNQLHGSIFEYFRNDALDARNFFDGANPSVLRLNQFGGSVGGPLAKDKAFFFGGIEVLKQRTLSPIVQNTLSTTVRGLRDCTPSDPANINATTPTCMSPRIRPLLAAFPVGQSPTSSPFFDQVNVAVPSSIDEYSGNLRFDFQLNTNNKMYTRYNRDQGYSLRTSDASGSFNTETVVPQNLVLALNSVLSNSVVNEVKVGFNASKTRVVGYFPSVPGLDLSGTTISISGTPNFAGVSQFVNPTGQIKVSSAFAGRAAPYTNYSLSFIDNLSWIHRNHNAKFGVEIRPQRIKSAFYGGTAYSFNGVQAFLGNTPAQIQVIDDSTNTSPFTGKSGFWNIHQQFYIAYAQDEWKIKPNFTMNYGLRFEYYTPMHETNDRVLWFDVPTATLIPNFTGNWYRMRKNFGPRLGFTWSPDKFNNKTVFRVGGGYYFGPGLGEGQTQPAQNDRAQRTISAAGDPLLTFPTNTAGILAGFDVKNPNLGFQPRAYLPDYRIPENILAYSASIQQELPGRAVLTIGYVGSQGRNLFVRGITNRITQVLMNTTTGAAVLVREFSQCNGGPCGPNLPNSTVVTNRFAEIDVKTSGGFDKYNALQLILNRRFAQGLTLGSQYMWSHSIGNTDGSKDAQTSSNNYTFQSEKGNNTSDVRQTFNFNALYDIPYGAGKKYGASASPIARTMLGGWQVGTLFNARTGLPIDVLITRPDVVYQNTTTGAITANPVVGAGGVIQTVPIINVPGGGNSRNRRRPDLVPGVDPYLHGVQGKGAVPWLNPAAFAVPQPGTFGNLARNAVRGPGMYQWDLTLSKKFTIKEEKNVEFRAECYNILNHPVFQIPNYATVSGGFARLADATGVLQPGQAYTSGAAGGNFGALTSTVSNQVGAGTNRQFQMVLRVNF